MTPEREARLRAMIKMRYGTDASAVFNAAEELLQEIDKLRNDLRILAESDHRFRDNMKEVLKEINEAHQEQITQLKRQLSEAQAEASWARETHCY